MLKGDVRNEEHCDKQSDNEPVVVSLSRDIGVGTTLGVIQSLVQALGEALDVSSHGILLVIGSLEVVRESAAGVEARYSNFGVAVCTANRSDVRARGGEVREESGRVSSDNLKRTKKN